LLWTGRPGRVPILKRHLFFLLFIAICVVSDLVLFLTSFGIIWLVYVAFHTYICAAQTYAITDKRVLIFYRPKWLVHTEIPAGKAVWLVETGNQKTGTLWIAEEMPWPFMPAYYNRPFDNILFGNRPLAQMLRASTTALFNIPKPRSVKDIPPLNVMPSR